MGIVSRLWSMAFFGACFSFLGPGNTSSHTLDFGPSAACLFCHVSKENGFDILWEDENLVAFYDYKPAAQQHILIIPRSHIVSVRALGRLDKNFVESMENIGHKLLDDLGVSPTMRRMGFHIPPFNSVNHLHLHVHGLPYLSVAKAAKYPVANGRRSYHKGTSWFVEVGQAIRILADGGKIGILPC